MESNNHNSQQTPSRSVPIHEATGQSLSPKPGSKSAALLGGSKGLRVIQVVLLGCITIMLVGAVILLGINDNKDDKAAAYNENRLVDSSKLQSVFLVNGQVYFGKIKTLNKDYLTMSDIYYLQVEQQVQPGQEDKPVNPVLKKLGCELHRPSDSMVINRSQVTFWENLKDDSNAQTIPGAVKQYAAANKGEQKCETAQTTNPTPTPTPAANKK